MELIMKYENDIVDTKVNTWMITWLTSQGFTMTDNKDHIEFRTPKKGNLIFKSQAWGCSYKVTFVESLFLRNVA